MLTKVRSVRRLALITLGFLAAACNGFGTTNITSPGNTSNIPPQASFRVVGRIGTPFNLYISDARSSWIVKGVAPLNVVIVNEKPPVRVIANKLVSDSSLLSVEILAGFTVRALTSSSDNFGLASDAFQQPGQHNLPYAPAASPDARFYVKGPATEVFNALIEDQKTSNLVETRVPAVIIYDSPNGGDSSGPVDGIFNPVTLTGKFDIDLVWNGVVVDSVSGTGSQTIKFQ
ncbi:MAG: hypothetical protein ABSG46_06030 [Candidatus Binataceae bacterium]|jgi:hypothetical protein